MSTKQSADMVPLLLIARAIGAEPKFNGLGSVSLPICEYMILMVPVCWSVAGTIRELI
jgi:hypothetical protein